MTKFRTAALLFALILPPLTACDSPEEKLANYIERGNELMEEENFVKARLEYKNAARLDPTSPEVRYRLGMVDEAQGDIHNAFANFMNAEHQDKNHAPSLLKLAQYFMASNQLAESLKRLNTIFLANPNNVDAIAILAAIKLRQGNLEEAENEAKRALKINEGNVTAIAVLTGLYKKQGNIEKAGNVLEEGILKNKKDDSLLLLKVSLYKMAKDFSKVREAYASLFKSRPDNVSYRQSFASELLKQKLVDEAETFMRKTVEDFPKNWDIKYNLVSLLSSRKGADVAEAEIRKYMEAYPDEDKLYFWLADLYITHKNTDKAAVLLAQIVEKDTDNAMGLNAKASLARINIVKGDKTLAKKLVEAVLAKEPSHKDALYIRANLAFEEGAYQQATGDLRTIIRDDPKAAKAYQLLAEGLLIQGRIDLAIDTLGQLIDRNPTVGMDVRVRLAQMFDASDNPQQGLSLLSVVTKAEPNYPFGWESTARIALKAANLDLAHKAIEKVKTIKGYEVTASYLNAQLLAKQGKIKEAAEELKKITLSAGKQPIAVHAIKSLKEVLPAPELTAFLSSLPVKTAFSTTELGNAYLHLKQTDKAAAAFNEAIIMKARQADPYIKLAKIKIEGNNLSEAYSLLKQASVVDPSDYIAPIIAADILTRQGKYEQAISLYEAILARNPDVHAASNNMADLIATKYPNDSEKLEKARLVAERFISSPNPLLLDTLAWVYYRQGKTQQALTIAQRAMAINDKLPAVVHYHYGRILFDTKDTVTAKAQIKLALDSKDDFEGKDDAEALMKLMK